MVVDWALNVQNQRLCDQAQSKNKNKKGGGVSKYVGVFTPNQPVQWGGGWGGMCLCRHSALAIVNGNQSKHLKAYHYQYDWNEK